MYFCLFCFLGLQVQHMEGPGLRVKSELQLLAYTTAKQDPSRVCDLYHSSQQCWIRNPLSEARDRTGPASSWILVRFASPEPQWELLFMYLKFFQVCFLFPERKFKFLASLAMKSRLSSQVELLYKNISKLFALFFRHSSACF